MKVDTYHSEIRNKYCLVVPSGVNPETITSAAKEGIMFLLPRKKAKTSVELEGVARGELLEHLENQIEEVGAGLIQTSVTFDEIAQ